MAMKKRIWGQKISDKAREFVQRNIVQSNNAIIQSFDPRTVVDSISSGYKRATAPLFEGADALGIAQDLANAEDVVLSRLRREATAAGVKDAEKLGVADLRGKLKNQLDDTKSTLHQEMKPHLDAYDAADKAYGEALWDQRLDGLEQFGSDAWNYMGRVFSTDESMGGTTGAMYRLGAYAGAAVGLRYLSGGSLTRNNRGERDIAGVPFL